MSQTLNFISGNPNKEGVKNLYYPSQAAMAAEQ